MLKAKSSKLMFLFIIILLLIIGVMLGQNYRTAKEQSQKREVFINHLYFSMGDMIHTLNILIEQNPSNEKLEEHISNLHQHLLYGDALVQSAHLFLENEFYGTSFFKYSAHFLYGINMQGVAEIPPFAENNKLDEEERAILKTIKDSIETAQLKMHSEETGQENPNLTFKQLSDIFYTDLVRFHDEIYRDAQKLY